MMNLQNNIFLILTVFTGVIALAFGSEEFPCVENSNSCLRNEDCCGGCCFKEKCVEYSKSCNKESNPCSNHVCPPNTVCYLQKVFCIRAPCPPIPTCKPIG